MGIHRDSFLDPIFIIMPSNNSAMFDQMMEPFDYDLKDEARRKKAREKKKTQRLNKKLFRVLDASGESTLGPKKKVPKVKKEKKEKRCENR